MRFSPLRLHEVAFRAILLYWANDFSRLAKPLIWLLIFAVRDFSGMS